MVIKISSKNKSIYRGFGIFCCQQLKFRFKNKLLSKIEVSCEKLRTLFRFAQNENLGQDLKFRPKFKISVKKGN